MCYYVKSRTEIVCINCLGENKLIIDGVIIDEENYDV